VVNRRKMSALLNLIGTRGVVWKILHSPQLDYNTKKHPRSKVQVTLTSDNRRLAKVVFTDMTVT